MQRTASAIAACCIRHRSVLRWASHRTAFFIRPYCHYHVHRLHKDIRPAGFPPPKSLYPPGKILAKTSKDIEFTHFKPLTKRRRLLDEIPWAFRQNALDYQAKRRTVFEQHALDYQTMRKKLSAERTKNFRQNPEGLWAKQVRALDEAERAFERKSENLWTKHWNTLG